MESDLVSMKVLLIRPAISLLPWEICSTTPPLGLAYIAGYLEQKGYNVRILDVLALGQRKMDPVGVQVGLDWKEISRLVRYNRPDVVGISSLFSSQEHNVSRTAQIVKEYDKDIPVVVGGAHPSSLPNEVLCDPNVDYAVIGEGESSFHELLIRLEYDKSLADVDGLAYSEHGEIRVNQKRKYIENLDGLPWPARHLLPMEKYTVGRGAELMRTPCTTMITSRGCPMNCIFCSTHSVWGWKWRSRSAEKVVDEIEFLVDRYRIREIHFEDDNLTLDKRRMVSICDSIVERGLDITWTTPNGVAIWTLDKKLLQKMKKSGCYSLCFGIESGDDKTLKFIGKRIDLIKAKEIIGTANDVGIWTHGFFVFGFPYEKKTSVFRTLNYAVKSDLDLASFFIATPYPGTELFKIMEAEGRLVKSKQWCDYRTMKAVADTNFLNRKELDYLQRYLYISFFRRRIMNYLKPSVLASRVRRLKSVEDLRFVTRIVKRYQNILKKPGEEPIQN